jgi:hypothetical protein
MRHAWTLLAAAVIAPLAWLLLAFGQDRSLRALPGGQATGELTANGFVRPALCLAAAGILLGLLASLRVSPLGAVVTGIAYCASYVVLLVSPDRVAAALPDRLSLAGRSVDPTLPLRSGTALMIGVLLLIGVVSAGRWRRWPARPDVSADHISTRPGPYGMDDENAADAQRYAGWDRPLGADGLGLLPAMSRDGRDAADPRSSDRPARPAQLRRGDDRSYPDGYERGDYHRGAHDHDAEYAYQSRWLPADGESFRG